MNNVTYQISKPQRDRILISIAGTLHKKEALTLEHTITSELAPILPQSVFIIVILDDSITYDLEGRRILTRIHSFLATKAKRTAYVAKKGQLRGMALWIMAVAGDQNSKPVATMQQAVKWIEGTQGRIEDATSRVSKIAEGIKRLKLRKK